MIVIMQVGATKAQVAHVAENVKAMGLSAHIIEGQERTIVAVVGDERNAFDQDALGVLDGVERIMPVLAPYKIASREVHPANSPIPFNGSSIGDNRVVIIAGPRVVEDPESLPDIAATLKKMGAVGLLCNIFGSSFSPYASQATGERALEVLAKSRDKIGMPIIAEVTEPKLVSLVAPVADILLVGGHNMQNFPLLTAVGESQHIALLKRGVFNTMEELLMAAEYILARGNRQVILCESGIRTPEGYTRNTTFDVNAVPVLKTKTYLPILVDASYAAAYGEFVPAIAKAAVAAGADGLIVEVETTPNPDFPQAVDLDQFAALVKNVRRVAEAVGRTV